MYVLGIWITLPLTVTVSLFSTFGISLSSEMTIDKKDIISEVLVMKFPDAYFTYGFKLYAIKKTIEKSIRKETVNFLVSFSNNNTIAIIKINIIKGIRFESAKLKIIKHSNMTKLI